jgi:hypothetical protein
MFPRPTPIPTRPCRECGTPARLDRMVQGLGEKCARDAGLLGSTKDLGQDGPNLLDLLADEPEDCCDGWDRD